MNYKNIIFSLVFFGIISIVSFILMTKLSELSFYAGFGIPIIIEPSIGSLEDFSSNSTVNLPSSTSSSAVPASTPNTTTTLEPTKTPATVPVTTTPTTNATDSKTALPSANTTDNPTISLQNAIPTPTVSPVSNTTKNGFIAYGKKNDNVKILQNFLKNRKLFSGDSTGYFGPLTKQALCNFQVQNGLSSSSPSCGNLGPWTDSIIDNKYGGYGGSSECIVNMATESLSLRIRRDLLADAQQFFQAIIGQQVSAQVTSSWISGLHNQTGVSCLGVAALQVASIRGLIDLTNDPALGVFGISAAARDIISALNSPNIVNPVVIPRASLGGDLANEIAAQSFLSGLGLNVTRSIAEGGTLRGTESLAQINTKIGNWPAGNNGAYIVYTLIHFVALWRTNGATWIIDGGQISQLTTQQGADGNKLCWTGEELNLNLGNPFAFPPVLPSFVWSPVPSCLETISRVIRIAQ